MLVSDTMVNWWFKFLAGDSFLQIKMGEIEGRRERRKFCIRILCVCVCIWILRFHGHQITLPFSQRKFSRTWGRGSRDATGVREVQDRDKLAKCKAAWRVQQHSDFMRTSCFYGCILICTNYNVHVQIICLI